MLKVDEAPYPHLQTPITILLCLQPSYAPAWRGLGDLARESGNNAHAVECYRVGVTDKVECDVVVGCGWFRQGVD
jgi:hypothetical protein